MPCSPSLTVANNAFQLLPRFTDPPAASCIPNEVVIQLTTTLVVPDYSKYFNDPISQFTPAYTALPDGSLLTPPYQAELQFSNANLLIVGMLIMFFFRNVLVTGNFLRRVQIKNRYLFRVLFVSQFAGLATMVPFLIARFTTGMACRTVGIMSDILAGISISLLLYWNLGYKAYRCLDNSYWVTAGLCVWQCATGSMVILDMLTMTFERTLTGRCIRTDDLRFARAYMLLQFGSALFVCLCFFYALWRSRNSPVERGRISIQLSLDECPQGSTVQKNIEIRGWWDYTPAQKEGATSSETSTQTKQGFLPRIRAVLAKAFGKPPQPGRKPSLKQEYPIPQPPRSSTARDSEPSPQKSSSFQEVNHTPTRQSSSLSSLNHRLTRLIPTMHLLRATMKDELCYTTFITGSCVVVAVIAIIGSNFNNTLAVLDWVAFSWTITSFLAIHSLGRVVKRHEKEALLQNPSSWGSPEPMSSSRRGVSRRQWPAAVPASTIGRVRRIIGRERDLDDSTNPFSDSRGLNSSRISWQSDFSASSYSSSERRSSSSSIKEDGEAVLLPPSLAFEDSQYTATDTTMPVSRRSSNRSSNGPLLQEHR